MDHEEVCVICGRVIPAGAARYRRAGGELHETCDQRRRPRSASDTAFAASQPDARPRVRVLVVEDDPAVQVMLTDYLSSERYDVAVAASGAAALDAVRDRRPDAIVLDLGLPGRVSGRQVLNTIAAYVPVIVITARMDEQLRDDVRRAGASAFLAKPFRLEELRAAVAAALSREGPACPPNR